MRTSNSRLAPSSPIREMRRSRVIASFVGSMMESFMGLWHRSFGHRVARESACTPTGTVLAPAPQSLHRRRRTSKRQLGHSLRRIWALNLQALGCKGPPKLPTDLLLQLLAAVSASTATLDRDRARGRAVARESASHLRRPSQPLPEGSRAACASIRPPPRPPCLGALSCHLHGKTEARRRV